MALFWALGLSQGTPHSRSQAPIDLARGIGLLAANLHGKYCLSITNGALKPGREIILYWVPVEAERYKPEPRRGKITAKLSAPCDKANRQAGHLVYQVNAGKVEIGRIYSPWAVERAACGWLAMQ